MLPSVFLWGLYLLCSAYHCLKKLGLLAAISKRHPLPARVPLLEEVDNREEDSDADMLNVIDEGRISDPQIMCASNTARSCNTGMHILIMSTTVLTRY